MSSDIWRDRERGFEEQWALVHDAELIEKLRSQARLEEITEALAKKLEVDQPDLLRRVIDLGITLETGPALLLAPLVQIAWAEARVTEQERAAVLRLAVARGLAEDSPAYAQLVVWLDKRPSDALFDTAVEVIQAGFAVLPPAEREARVVVFAKACEQVAEASGGGLARLLGMHHGVSAQEHAILDRIKASLRAPA